MRLFCPKCGDEFVAGIEVCPDCGLSLVDQPPIEETPDPGEGEDLVTVATFQTVFDASVAKGALEAAGVAAFVPRELAGSFSRLPQHEIWAELKVRKRDRDFAVELLRKAGHR
ncbi:MAG: hypothetical protein M3167_08145 [Acidobacteriota bacterium]|nr:hypothetical protein [Acidobacteriota bacterium]